LPAYSAAVLGELRDPIILKTFNAEITENCRGVHGELASKRLEGHGRIMCIPSPVSDKVVASNA
jgi:hypothetical protein